MGIEQVAEQVRAAPAAESNSYRSPDGPGVDILWIDHGRNTKVWIGFSGTLDNERWLLL